MAEATLEERIREFQASLTVAVPLNASPIDWGAIDTQVSRAEPAIQALDLLGEKPAVSPEDLAKALSTHPFSRRIIESILALPENQLVAMTGGSGADGSLTHESALQTAEQVLAMGFSRFLGKGHSIRDMYVVSLVIAGGASRKIRQGRWLEEQVEQLLARVAVELKEKRDLRIQFTSGTGIPKKFRKRIDYLVSIPGRPSVGIKVAFQEQYGGRQYSEMTGTYPDLASELSAAGIFLVVVADGPGLRSASQAALTGLMRGVYKCLSLQQASAGALADAIEAVPEPRPRVQPRVPDVSGLIQAQLEQTGEVKADALPLPVNDARVAIASFLTQHPELLLDVSPEGAKLGWKNLREVQAVQNLRSNPTAVRALTVGLDVLKVVFTASKIANPADPIATAVADVASDSVLPSQIVVAGSAQQISRELCVQLSRDARQLVPAAKLAILVSATPVSASLKDDIRIAQRSLAVGIVVIDFDDLLRYARTKGNVRDKVIQEVLRTSDLSKASPYVVNSVTPARIFFGRSEEAATLVSTLVSNSAALLGGRRIGKTSLMRHVEARLKDAGSQPIFIDCQAAKTWADFGDLLRKQLGEQVPHDFSPGRLLAAFEARPRNVGPLILIMDEIDQLLQWDSVAREKEVPEALFKVFRTLSQAGTAQFLFSGERTVTIKIADPQSPHWNFCRPILLRQLTRADAQSLLIEPLKALQIEIQDEGTLRELVWERTSGHPQLVQSMGAFLIRDLNETPPLERKPVSATSLAKYVDSFEFAEHYLETNWGQATRMEQALSLLVAKGTTDVAALRTALAALGYETTIEELGRSLRMLEVYGLVDRVKEGFQPRIGWLAGAAKPYGGLDALIALRKAGG